MAQKRCVLEVYHERRHKSSFSYSYYMSVTVKNSDTSLRLRIVSRKI